MTPGTSAISTSSSAPIAMAIAAAASSPFTFSVAAGLLVASQRRDDGHVSALERADRAAAHRRATARQPRLTFLATSRARAAVRRLHRKCQRRECPRQRTSRPVACSRCPTAPSGRSPGRPPSSHDGRHETSASSRADAEARTPRRRRRERQRQSHARPPVESRLAGSRASDCARPPILRTRVIRGRPDRLVETEYHVGVLHGLARCALHQVVDRREDRCSVG